jgi:hypothetical protein
MTKIEYDEQILSDLHKDARGFRPREYFWSEWNSSTVAERNEIWNGLLEELTIEIEREKNEKILRENDFKNEIQSFIEAGAGDEETALRWMLQGEEFFHEQQLEGWFWERGVLFTEYGKKMLTLAMKFVKYEEYA